MEARELVLRMGLESDQAEIYRSATPAGDWVFHVESEGTMSVDRYDDENWSSSTPKTKKAGTDEPIDRGHRTLQTALEAISSGGRWLAFFPISIHPDYKATMWKLAQETASQLSEESVEMWERSQSDWRERCFGEDL